MHDTHVGVCVCCVCVVCVRTYACVLCVCVCVCVQLRAGVREAAIGKALSLSVETTTLH